MSDPPDSANDARLDRIEQRLEALQALLERSYERTLDAAALVMRARRSAGYDEAYGEEPLVTIRMGAHQSEGVLLERALPSVLAQTYENWELIIVFDGPEPAQVERISGLGDDRIRCLQRPRNGPYPSEPQARWQVAGCHPFNEAVAHARGAWIAPIDDDDEWTPDHLAVLLSAARRTGAELVYGSCLTVVGARGETYFGAWPPEHGNFGFQAAIYHAGLSELTYDANAHLFDLPGDWHLARRMLEAGVRFDYVERIVGTYHVPESGSAIDRWVETMNVRGAFGGDAG